MSKTTIKKKNKHLSMAEAEKQAERRARILCLIDAPEDKLTRALNELFALRKINKMKKGVEKATWKGDK